MNETAVAAAFGTDRLHTATMRRVSGTRFSALALALAGLTLTSHAFAGKTLADYRYFRALSVDLQGRAPTRDEVAAFESDTFDTNRWIDEQLAKPAYAERLRRIYADALRLDVPTSFGFNGGASNLRQAIIKDATGKDTIVFYRTGQRRPPPAGGRGTTDRQFCLTPDETGFNFTIRTPAPVITATQPDPRKAVSQALLDAYTTEVKPWWLYQNPNAPTPDFDPQGLFTPLASKGPDGTTPLVKVRVCKEEAQETAAVTVTIAGSPKTVSCASGIAFASSSACGCGPRLERCLPGSSGGNDPGAFTGARDTLFGLSSALTVGGLTQRAWQTFWWRQEAEHFLEKVFATDRDMRDILASKASVVNGPLVQLYRSTAPANSVSFATANLFGDTQQESLFDPKALPNLQPYDFETWTEVANRSPHASGILTMPIFLLKYGTRRARAHIVYNAFLCQEFVAENVALTPSTEPNLMVRSGCAACHKTLEPLSAYFTRVTESGWSFLPANLYPAKLTATEDLTSCKAANGTLGDTTCKSLYDPAFTTTKQSLLRGAYGSLTKADLGPRGLAAEVTQAPEFASCIISTLSAGLLGRPLTTDDKSLLDEWRKVLVDGGFRARALVKAIVTSETYKAGNDISLRPASGGGAP
jgi:hypothetical protein